MKKINPWLLTSITIILVIVITPIFGNVYELIFGKVYMNFFWGPNHPEYFNGFLMSLIFVISLITTLYGGKTKYYIILLSTIVLLLFVLLLRSGNDLIIDAVAALIGWLLGEGILRLYKMKK